MNESEFEQFVSLEQGVSLIREGELAIRVRLEEEINKNPKGLNAEEARSFLEAFEIATDIVEVEFASAS